MRPRALVALSIVLGWSLAGHPAAPEVPAPGNDAPVTATVVEATEAPREAPPDPAPWAHALPAIVVRNTNTGAEGSVRLYRDDGAIDDLAVDAFCAIASGGSESSLDRRLLQLVVKAAYHFGAGQVDSISAWRPTRKGKGNKHASGEAIDFRIPGVKAAVLASYLRTLARVGVGLYTHPRTQYVHLDVRDESYHWLDGSPPGVTWRERGLPDGGRAARDAAWTPEADLPAPPP